MNQQPIEEDQAQIIDQALMEIFPRLNVGDSYRVHNWPIEEYR